MIDIQSIFTDEDPTITGSCPVFICDIIHHTYLPEIKSQCYSKIADASLSTRVQPFTVAPLNS